MPEIDALVGVNNRADIVRAVLGETPKRRNAKNAETRKDRKQGRGEWAVNFSWRIPFGFVD